MSTPYSEIYDLYAGMTTDYEKLSLPIETQDIILEGWLLSAIGEFRKCKTDLSDRDKVIKQFNQTLSDEEKKILARLMLAEWLNPILYSLDNLRNNMSSKDFNVFSPANLLKEIRITRKEVISENNDKIRSYLYANFNPLKDLTPHGR